MTEPAPETAPAIDGALAARLIAGQFPRWAGLPVRPVELDGWDHRTFRLGDDMLMRLPSAARYAAQVAKEQHWLPRLAAQLPLQIPQPLAIGVPGEGYRWHWSVYRWLDGEVASRARIDDPVQFALTLARFLSALQRIDAAGGPPAGRHNFFRGGPLTVYDAETRHAIATLEERQHAAKQAGAPDLRECTRRWEAALRAHWHGPPVWVHGDVATGNLLVRGGRLSAVIDFGSSGVGDPACDLVIAWTSLTGEARAAFREAVAADGGTWARAQGWALWKSLITLAAPNDLDPESSSAARRTIDQVLADRVPVERGRGED